MKRRSFLTLTASAASLPLLPQTALAAPKAEIWDRWTAHDPASLQAVDHALWQGFLSRYVIPSSDGINRIAYGGVSREHQADLQLYLEDLSKIEISAFNRAEQFAYWANLYNALTVQVVLDHYPVASIRDIAISPGLFTRGPWGASLIEVEQTPLTLDDIEHRILRPIWKDPRVHYAVNCASLGCPNLQTEAFSAEKLEEQLDKAAADFINHPRAVRAEGAKLKVSSLYDWFSEDFGERDEKIISHLFRYASADLKSRLEGFKRISGYSYDWQLNDATPSS